MPLTEEIEKLKKDREELMRQIRLERGEHKTKELERRLA